jgi:citrate lyase subunit beta/citryl-CoA lyase
MRSLLLLAADRDMNAELNSGADALIFDVTADAGDPDAPHRWALASLQSRRAKAAAARLYVLVHALESGRIDADLDCILAGRPDGIVLSGARHGADLQRLSIKLAVREAELGIDDGATKIIAMAGATAASLFDLASLAGASPRLVGLIFAQAALAQELGAASETLPDRTPTPPLALARNLVLFAAKAAGVWAIDAASPREIDAANLRAACESAKRDGFSGKLAVHSDQAAIINAVFAKR